MPGIASFHSVDLFGGAITVCLPKEFIDASDIRQVPDNQEVFLDKNGFTSIIVDITERLNEADAANDQAALDYHFSDAMNGSEDKTTFGRSDATTFRHMPNAPAYTLLAIREPSTEPQERSASADFTAILFTMLRLKDAKTDIIVSINVPHSIARRDFEPEDVDINAGKLTPLLEAAVVANQRIADSLEIKDWTLFVNEG